MDFGVVSHKQTSPDAVGSGPAEPGDESGHRSTNLKHPRSGIDEDTWKSLKMPKPGEVDFSSRNSSESFGALGRSNLWTLGLDDGQKMLSFSTSEPYSNNGSSRSIAFSVLPDANHSRTGGGFNEGIRGAFARLKGPFTPSQWMELEHQALIYKHILANVPVPSNLLLPIKKSLYSYGSYASNLLGWGPFHLGSSGSNDPEPGRCRRTDGKKWRCSRDAVPDQKYCERHINRGRHRSRKPVEGQTGHAVTGPTKVAPMAHSGVISSGLGAVHQQIGSLQTSTASASSEHLGNRLQGFQGLSLILPTVDLKSKDPPFILYEKSSPSEFGFVSSDSLLNPSERISYINTKTPDESLFGFKDTNDPHPVRHFIDDWPKDPEELKPDWTQLSMSIPMGPEKSTLSTLRRSNEPNLIHMSLGVSHDPSWLPVSWGSSMGGPLGEVLTTTTTACAAGQESVSLVGSSPTGVLQKCSGSNSSSVSTREC